jgi:hypothetical protein
MIPISELRKRLRITIENARRDAAERRSRMAASDAEYERFLNDIAVPVFRMFAGALRAEGLLFNLETPAGTVRLVSERSEDDYVEIALDTSRDVPVVVGRSSYRLGRRLTERERPVREEASVSELIDEDVVAFVLEELKPFVEK